MQIKNIALDLNGCAIINLRGSVCAVANGGGATIRLAVEKGEAAGLIGLVDWKAADNPARLTVEYADGRRQPAQLRKYARRGNRVFLTLDLERF